MKIDNIRLGHATNSSSSHSIVIIPDSDVGRFNDDTSDLFISDEYGWDRFILASPEEKRRYLAVQMKMNMTGFKEDEAAHIVNEVLGTDIGPEAYIDHQSVISVPAGGDLRLQKFMKEMTEYVANSENMVIFGGHDNDGEMPEAEGYNEPAFLSTLPRDDSRRKIKFKQDGDYWVIYNPVRGGKTRMTFNDDAPLYTKANFPELVDVKITQFCNYGCPFCYQSSTKEGQHASIEQIRYIAKYLADNEVFEVAIGGGEPTKHPNFWEIINIFGDHGITANFTTFGTDWINGNEETIQEIVSSGKLGGIGVSVHSAKDLNKVEKIQDKIRESITFPGGGFGLPQVMAQHVVGTTSEGELATLINDANERWISLLLLGYKDVGFGAEYERYISERFDMTLKLALKRRLITSISVDTALLQQYPNLPDQLGINAQLYNTQEGKFSMYIDAVDGKMAKSSYVDPSEYVQLPVTENGQIEHEAFISHWNSW